MFRVVIMSARSNTQQTEIESAMSIIRDDSAQDQRLVLKGNALVEGRYKLSLIAQKMFIAMVSRVNPTDEKLPGFVLTREELLKMDIGVSKATAYRQFSDACIELLGLRVSVVERNLKTGEVDETDINIFSKNTRTWKDQSRTSLKQVDFRFTDDVDPYLRDFSRDIHYTKYLYRFVRDLQSSHSIRIYELLRRWRNIKETKPVISKTVFLDDLREMLGVEPSAYPNYSNFKKRIIEPSQKQIEKSTDIRFSFTGVAGGRGRKITAIRFDIYENRVIEAEAVDEVQEVTGLVIPDGLEIDKSVQDKLTVLFPEELGSKNQQALYDLFETYDIPAIKESISDFMFATISKEIKSSPYKYFLGICKNKQKEYSAVSTLEKQERERRGHRTQDVGRDIDDLLSKLEED